MVLTICLIIGVLLAYFGPVLLRRAMDRTGNLDVPPVPETPDPHRIAYLRGGENEVVRLMLFDLVRRGHLEMTETQRLASTDRRLRRPDTAPEGDKLSDLEARMVGFFGRARKPVDIYRSEIPDLVRQDRAAEKTALARERMLIPEAVDRRVANADFLMVAAGCLLGFALGVNAFDHVAIGIGLAALFLFARKLVKRHMRRTGHMSALGRRYLAALKAAFPDSKAQSPAVASARMGLGRDDPLLAVGLYGSLALIGTDHAAFAHMIPAHPVADFGAGMGADGGFGGFGGGDGGCGGGGCGGGG